MLKKLAFCAVSLVHNVAAQGSAVSCEYLKSLISASHLDCAKLMADGEFRGLVAILSSSSCNEDRVLGQPQVQMMINNLKEQPDLTEDELLLGLQMYCEEVNEVLSSVCNQEINC